MIAWSTLFDAENVFRLLPVGVPRSMEENVPQKNHFRLLSDNRQRGLYAEKTDLVAECNAAFGQQKS